MVCGDVLENGIERARLQGIVQRNRHMMFPTMLGREGSGGFPSVERRHIRVRPEPWQAYDPRDRGEASQGKDLVANEMEAHDLGSPSRITKVA